ncbi:OmpA family protein [uncultured Shimia sp.]|uniref:OmpA family protein n=1 Tax=uncultured Shimia sp. TaxID=573152 RepID=UPI00261ACAAB|nr:OmpA family protein [uncultured Shimia sp.]
MHRLLLSGAAAIALMCGAVSAQTMSKYGTDNRWRAIGELTDAQLGAVLHANGRVSMSGTFFASDSATLSDGANEVLFKLARVLEGMPDARLAVVGHTDSTGDFSSNLELSQTRAQAVVDALVAAPNNVDPARLAAVGVGAIDPVASNTSTEGRALNRRVSFVLIDAADKASADGAWIPDPVTGCLIWNSGQPSDGEGASWNGACKDGKANGRGTAVFWDANGLEGRFDGDLQNGKADGPGVAWARNDDMTGYDRYEGYFVAGEAAGEVTITTTEGYVFIGEFLEDGDHAVGELTTPEGWVLQGEIKDGQTVGSALAYFETEEGELYFGDVENNAKNGFGMMISPNETSYIGEFKEGSPSGLGVFEDTAGSQFVGQFDAGSPNGVGTAVDSEGVAYQGRFIDGVPDGVILVTDMDGTQRTETWQNGSKVE